MPDPNTVPRDPNTFGYTTAATDEDIRVFQEGLHDPMSAWSQTAGADASLGPEVDNAALIGSQAFVPEAPSPEHPGDAAAPASAPAEIDYKQRYGDVQNQLGRERAAHAAAIAAAEARSNDLAQRLLMSQPQQLYQQPYAASAPAPSVSPEDFRIDLFPRHEPDALLSKNDVNDAIRNVMANEWTPALRQVQSNAFQAAVAHMQRQSGRINFTPVEAQSVLSEVPSLGYLPPAEREIAIQRLAEARRTAAGTAVPSTLTRTAPTITPAAPASVPAAPVMVDPRRVIRQQTYVESAAPVTARTTVEPPTPEALKAQMASEFANLKTAAEMEAWFVKHGVTPAQDWSGPVAAPVRGR